MKSYKEIYSQFHSHRLSLYLRYWYRFPILVRRWVIDVTTWPLQIPVLEGHRLKLSNWEEHHILFQPYEPNVCSLLERFVQPSWICVDVGAHIGLMTLLLAKLVGKNGQIVAFEAHPDNARTLRKNVALNGYGDRIKVESVAVSDGTTAYIHLYPGRLHNSSEWNTMGHDVEGRPTDAEMQIPALALDVYFKPGERVHFIKVDIEGAGAQALIGMQRLLCQERPTVLMEIHNHTELVGMQCLIDMGYDLQDLFGRRLENSQYSKQITHCLAIPIA